MAGTPEPREVTTSRSALRITKALFFFIARAAFGVFLLITSVYCLLLYIPFTYFGFIHNPLLAWLPAFVRIHSYLYVLLVAAVAITLIPELRAERTRRSAAAFVGLHVAVGIYLLFRPALATMLRDFFAYVWSMLALFPLLWLASLDLVSDDVETRNHARARMNLATTTFAAIAVTLTFAATSLLQRAVHASEGAQALSALSLAASLVAHLAIFTLFGAAVLLIGVVSRKTGWPHRTGFLLNLLLAWMVCGGVIRYIVLPTISFDGLQANIFAATTSLVFVLYVSGLIAGVRAAFASTKVLQSGAVTGATLRVTAAAGLATAAYYVPIQLGPTDWDFVLQKLAVVLIWGLAIALLRCSGGWLHTQTARRMALAILICGAIGLAAFQGSAHSRAVEKGMDWDALFDNYAGADISFKTAYDILSRSVNNEAYSGFYQFLRDNTNLGRNVTVRPADVKLVDNLQPTPGVKPNIFFFVFDSLRRDYVGPYNSSVDFTPQIDQFARDSVVMENAYSHYAGTALSEPAIWTGAMQLHKQYIEPFYPMNSLQKLLDTDGYESYISVDPILQIILHPSTNIVKLDEKAPLWSDLDFIPTVKELESKIDTRSDRSKPIFAYTQPQNVHTLNLERSRAHGTRREISIAELRRMDAAFGEFLGFLKARGLYENSIIILTSDHGDSYGEFGRYGHSDFLFPEVMRIPLIFHIPPRMQPEFVWDPRQVAFSLDITPSLYSLLGHGPIVKNELYGRPLFTRTREELDSYLGSDYLLVSSYAPVYGMLGDRGKSLFIVDAVNHRNYYFDLVNDPLGIHNRITPKIRDRGEQEIRRGIGLIDTFYHYSPPG